MGSSLHNASSDEDDSDATSHTSQGPLVMPINEEAPVEHDPIFVRNEEREDIPENDNILMIVDKEDLNKNCTSETKKVLIEEMDNVDEESMLPIEVKCEEAIEGGKKEIQNIANYKMYSVEKVECMLPIEVKCETAIEDEKEATEKIDNVEKVKCMLPIEVKCETAIEDEKEEISKKQNTDEDIQNIATELIDNIVNMSSTEAINDIEQGKSEDISCEKEEFIEAVTELKNSNIDFKKNKNEQVKEEIQKLLENIRKGTYNIEDSVPLEDTETNDEKQDKPMNELFQNNDSSLSDNEEYLDAIQDEMSSEHKSFKTLSDLYIQSHFEKIVNKDDLVKIIDYDDEDLSSNENISTESDSDNDHAIRQRFYRPKLTTGGCTIVYERKAENGRANNSSVLEDRNDTLDNVDLKENYVEEEKEVDEILSDNTKEEIDEEPKLESKEKGVEMTTQPEETLEQKEQQTTTPLSFTEEYYRIVANEDDTEYCSSTVLVEGIQDIRQQMRNFCEDYKDFSQKYMSGYYANFSEKKDDLKIDVKGDSSDDEEEKESKDDEVVDADDKKDIVEVQQEEIINDKDEDKESSVIDDKTEKKGDLKIDDDEQEKETKYESSENVEQFDEVVEVQQEKLDKESLVIDDQTETQIIEPTPPVIKRNVKLSLEMQLATGGN